MRRIKKIIERPLYKPYFIFLCCLILLLTNLILDGTLLSVLRLSQDLRVVKNRIEYIEQKNLKLENKIKEASDPNFVEQEVRQRLDFAEEGDLIFLFPENL